MAKQNWYASVNRSGNNKIGTTIRLTDIKHPAILAFISQNFERVEELLTINSEQLPAFLLNNKEWDRIAKNLKSGYKNKFVKVLYGSSEFCVICHKDFKQEIMDTELVRVAAEKKRDEEE